MRQNIYSFSADELSDWLENRRIKAYRANQIFQWLYQKRVSGFDEMTNLSKSLREKLKENFVLNKIKILDKASSVDGSVKFLFGLDDGNMIESVLMPERGHYTLCVSSQAGCAQGCRFCSTGKMGFSRNLECSEITGQVIEAMGQMENPDDLRNLVFMGMGEPLANYANLVKALGILLDNDFGTRFSGRRVTVSTVGLVNKMANLGRDTKANLAVSLNAADNETRSKIMPVNDKFDIHTLLEACRTFPLRPGRRITFEYVLLKGINDSPEHGRKLSNLLKNIKAKINLIPFNEFEGSPYKRPSEESVLAFQNVLMDKGFTTVIRRSKGEDISAACGQLKNSFLKKVKGLC